MNIAILPPTDDWIFKLIFGEERNKTILVNFLQAFVDLPDEEFELIFLDTHLKPEADDDKLGILDVKVRTKTGKIIDIEIQVNAVRNMGRRLSFYKSKLIVEQIGKAEHYDKIQRVICICIATRPLFPGTPEYLNRFRFRNEANNLCFEDIPEEIYTLELSKAPESSDGSAGWDWMRFFLSRSKEEFEMVAERNPEIRKAVDNLYELSSSDETRAQYEMRLKAQRDYAWRLDSAFQDGTEAGIEIGVERGIGIGMERGIDVGVEKVAINALAKGLPLELIRELTGLDPETIAGLKTDL